jgi:ribosome-associated protein
VNEEQRERRVDDGAAPPATAVEAARAATEHLLAHARWSASRAAGPGGQHKDKTDTRAELTVDAACLEGLPPATADRLAERLGLHARPLRITSQRERSLPRNQAVAAERLGELVAAALAPPPPPRRPTRPSRGQREARLSDKSQRGTVKRLRRPVDLD